MLLIKETGVIKLAIENEVHLMLLPLFWVDLLETAVRSRSVRWAIMEALEPAFPAAVILCTCFSAALLFKGAMKKRTVVNIDSNILIKQI